jgi:alkyl-hydroperoxide reductase/thiol specific antioxidant family protein
VKVLHHRKRIEAAGGTVLAIAFESPERMLRGLDFPWPVLLDRDRVAYREFGLRRAPRVALLRLDWVRGYARMLLRGDALARPGHDVLQLGGDFVVDREGVLVLAHPSAGFDDRAPVGALVRAIETAGGPNPSRS